MRAWSIKFVLRSIYLGLLITAILAPSFGVTEMEQRAAGKDIYFCVDLSRSMNASDVIPSRIEKAKSMILRTIEAMPENRIGLIVFSSEAYVQIPLTFDNDVLKYAVENLSTSLLPSSGTNITSAIEITQERIQDGTDREKLMVLVTDGEDFGNLNNLELEKGNLNAILVGVGTEAGYSLAIDNSLKNTSLNKDAMEKLAGTVKAPLFILDESNDPANEVLNYIESIKPNSFNETTVLVANNKYRYFLIPALLLIMLDMVFVVKIFRI